MGPAAEIVRRVLELREQLGRGVSVGISGVDCAGKSTLARAVHDELASLDLAAVLVDGDEFTRPTRERYADPDEGLGYYHDSFDYGALFERILPAVRDGVACELSFPVSDWENDAWREATLALPRDAVVIVEGCFLFAEERASEFDLAVWLNLPLAEVVPRALRRPRDLERMGGPDGVRERYANRYLPGQRLHLERDRPREQATLVVDASAVPADGDLPLEPG